MDILSILSEQTTSVALSLTIMWFYNKLVIDVLAERKELTESIRAERKEWLDSLRTLNDQVRNERAQWQATYEGIMERLIELSMSITEAITANRAELHALKGRITELVLAVQVSQKKESKSE